MVIVFSDLFIVMNGMSSSLFIIISFFSFDNNSLDVIQNCFLMFLIVQMKNQDFSNLMDNLQLIIQMVQLLMVMGISQLNNLLFMLMSNFNFLQVLLIVNMIGYSVLVLGNSIQLISDIIKDVSGMEIISQKVVFGVNLFGIVFFVVVIIKDFLGVVVYIIDLGIQVVGVVLVIWDGFNDIGGKVVDGNYIFIVSVFNNGIVVIVLILLFGIVFSVLIVLDGVKFNVINVGIIKLIDVV